MKQLLFAVFLILLGCISGAELSFEFQSRLLEEAENYRVYYVTYDSPEAPFWPEARQVKAFYYEPKTLPPEGAPAVLCLHILGGNGQLTKSIAAFFANHGMPALMPQTALFLDRLPKGNIVQILRGAKGPDYLIAALRATPGDIQRSIDFLASRPGVDTRHINLIGTSMGGILAVSTFAKDERLDKAVFLLAGGRLREILALDNPEVIAIHAAIQHATPEQSAEIERLGDLVEPMNFLKELAPKAQAGRIMMHNAELDKIIPPEFSDALADGLGLTLNVNHFILPKADHYTAVVALPQLLEDTLVFFGGDQRTAPLVPDADAAKLSAMMSSVKQVLEGGPDDATQVTHIALRFSVLENDSEKMAGRLRLTLGGGKFRLQLDEGIGLADFHRLAIGMGALPWVITPNGSLFQGGQPSQFAPALLLPDKFHIYRKMTTTLIGHVASTGSLDTLKQLVHLEASFQGADKRTFVANAEGCHVEIQLAKEREVPQNLRIKYGKMLVAIHFDQWEDRPIADTDFAPPRESPAAQTVNSEQLILALRQVIHRVWDEIAEGHAAYQSPLCKSERVLRFEKGLRIERPGEYPVLIFAGTPEEIGRQHGRLCKAEIQRSYACLRLVAGGYLLLKNEWFYDTIQEAQSRTRFATPERYLTELDAMSQAAGLTAAQGREIGFFPELFHCSGIAARGKATVGGRVVHARVLDYMKDIGLQSSAQIQVYLPDGYLPWITVGFAGFNGTVTAMNSAGLAIGEMGGRGEGNWDGLPMSYLMRRIMEECRTIEEAKQIIAATPLTCEYYYVLSDRSGAMAAVEARAGEPPTFLNPGQPHPMLREAFEDVVWITAPSRQTALCERLHQFYGRIDVETMKQIIRRP
ncbi:MAG: dienelactone hydrolase family protein, partial [Victivallales bacterium]|nr:dienelactone hydrolase family protein [Victivallales bacterium]